MSDAEERGSYVLTIFISVLGFVMSLFWGIYALYLWAFRCSDGCLYGGSWGDSLSSWQWEAQFLLAVVGVSLTAVSIVLATLKQSMFLIPMVLAAVLFGMWSILFSTSGM